MTAHQVITGALNKGESVFAVGSVEGINFTVCAVGCDVVILASNFERVQIIPGSAFGDEAIVTCVDCCLDSGKIAAAYGSTIRIFEPTHYIGEKTKHKLDYRWFETSTIETHGVATGVFWNLEGLRLLVSSSRRLQLYQHRMLSAYYSSTSTSKTTVNAGTGTEGTVSFTITDEDPDEKHDQNPQHSWLSVWETMLSAPARYIKYSPDGALFATCGDNDRIVKIWYQDSGECDGRSDVNFGFTYLQHPAAVVGFEWRKTGRYMPRQCIYNVLMTWCKDNTSRLWKETPSYDGADMSCETLDNASVDLNNRKKLHHKHFRMRNARHKITHRLKQLKIVKNKSTKKGGLTTDDHHGQQQQSPVRLVSSPSFYASAAGPFTAPNMLHFHLAASINAETDCFLVPSLESAAAADKPFAVHWLNNKELVFSLGAEKLLADALLSEQRDSRGHSPAITTSEDITKFTVTHSISVQSSVDSADQPAMTGDSAATVPSNTNPHTPSPGSGQSSDSLSKDVLDMKLEALLRQWYQAADILFTVHPIDGSLLIWTLEYLDHSSRQPTVSFSSRFPSAFPLTDAASLNPMLCTFNPHDPVYVELLQRNTGENGKQLQRQQANALFLLTSHENGSLNLWHLSMDEKSRFSTILNIAHKSRMCGHRFRISQVVCHSVLPLLLTASQHGKKACSDCSSELILWKVYPVGPLCKSGGVRELARVTSNSAKAFTGLAWVPAILPSSTLGSVCNSPSSCFVASDGHGLRVYQAVVDARGLLAEIYSGKTRAASVSSSSDHEDELPPKRALHDTFTVVSTQSTAKPGCVLQLAQLSDAAYNSESVLLLHVFHERLIVGETPEPHDRPAHSTPEGHRCEVAVIDRSKSAVFSDCYYVVLIEKDGQLAKAHMWSLEISSQPPAPIKRHSKLTNSGHLSSPEVEKGDFFPTADPLTPSAAQLYIMSKKVCTQVLSLPDGVVLLEATPAAGHLPSSSLYPACRAPYLLMTACSDDNLRFWRCCKDEMGAYYFREWRMISDTIDSAVEMDGAILGVASAHSSRLACVYEPAGMVHQRSGQEMMEKLSVEVAVFECESTGGVEWTKEDSLLLRDIFIPRGTHVCLGDFDFHDVKSPVVGMLFDWQHHPERHHPLSTLVPRIPSIPGIATNMKRAVSDHALRAYPTRASEARKLVRIDWVSTENGGHILTVGVGSKVFLYARVSEDVAQRNIVMMKEHETHKRPTLRKASSIAAPTVGGKRLVRWLCMRTLDLQSADGLPPLPTVLTWVRDGVLIVGMQSEMRCYNQWNMTSKQTNPDQPPKHPVEAMDPRPKQLKLLGVPNHSHSTLHISPSHSMLDALNKRGKGDSPAGAGKGRLRKDLPSRVFSAPKDLRELLFQAKADDPLLEAVSNEGLFEAARLSSPMLPQYHPKQLMELLNAGKNRRVKAILLHVLRCIKERNVVMPVGLNRAGSMRKSFDGSFSETSGANRGRSMSLAKSGLNDDSLDYDEIESIPPLPLYALIAADSPRGNIGGEADSGVGLTNGQTHYDDLFSEDVGGDQDLDKMLEEDDDDDDSGGKRSHSRASSVSSEQGVVPTLFSAKHNRILTQYLTHMHLPGLSSVDQMHLLAVADTLSHFSSDVMDKLTQANAALQPAAVSVIGEGYASAGAGIETVDECGLRFLMAMKQHEYLLLCLPLNQRKALIASGISSSHIIWALHSETETELLNAIPGLQKSQPTWEELKSLGVGWWLKNTSTLKTCVETIAKAAFQQKQDPMDAALFYLALKKKNVLMHLFKTTRVQQMVDFFSQDFTQEKWKKAALKNAFVLMGKQRFHHAAAFFLLGGSLTDAIQLCLQNLNDLQLVLVIVRLYETDPDKQAALMRQLLCRHILGMEVEEFEASSGIDEGLLEVGQLSPTASPDPFVRSMAYWLLKEYSRAASTLLDEATKGDSSTNESMLSDIFNFYSFLRKHPLVVRQRLTDAGVQIGSTEKFLAVAKQLESRVTPSERRLYFRTAVTHLNAGCPLLALDVLCRLPKGLSMVVPGSSTLSSLVGSDADAKSSPTHQQTQESVANFDWSAPTQPKDDKLELKWSDEEEEEEEDDSGLAFKTTPAVPTVVANQNDAKSAPAPPIAEKAPALDIMAQHLKFVASLRILMEELATLASGFEVDGGQLRYQLFVWLEKEVTVLKQLCDYNTDEGDAADVDGEDGDEEPLEGHAALMLHEALRTDRLDMAAKIRAAVRRRLWLRSNQNLLRSFASYCALHGSQGVGLTSARMELLLLLLELQQEAAPNIRQLNAPLPEVHSFPLLGASVTACRMFVLSPLNYLENQASDLLITVAEMTEAPRLDSGLAKVYMLYNLSQCLSSCLYQSLSDVESLTIPKGQTSGALTRRARRMSAVGDDIEVTTLPSRWPGVQNLIALLSREKDDDAPNLQLLLAECFVAVYLALFSYALAAYDSRWLFRLTAHHLDSRMFATVFGGGGEKLLSSKSAPPPRPKPPRPTPPHARDSSPLSIDRITTAIDSSSIRSKLNAKLFGPNAPTIANGAPASAIGTVVEQTVLRWVPPKKSLVSFFSSKPPTNVRDELGVDYDSEDAVSEVASVEESENEEEAPSQHSDPNSYAWAILRLALVKQLIYRLQQFLSLCGQDTSDLAAYAPRIDAVMKVLALWETSLAEEIRNVPGGCPVGFLPRSTVDLSAGNGPSLHKYRTIIEVGNTPFETDDPTALPVRRLWAYLVRQEHLMDVFIRHIFSHKQPDRIESRNDHMAGIFGGALPEAFKIVQREQDPIVAFALSQTNRGWIVVSTGRELQEMDISAVLDGNKLDWLYDTTELDIALSEMKKDPLKDNDDYQLLMEKDRKESAASFMTAFIVDRSRKALPKLLKRQVGGIRRIDAHPTLPYYVSGASDGSVRLWEWGIGQPLYTPRPASQYAKVTKVAFSANGNKFAAVDGDGLLCLWQVSHGMPIRKPFFNQKCHSKSASDVRFLGSASSLLVTAGYGSGEQNLALWDTLLPQNKAIIQSWSCHPEGASCVMYLPQQQTLISGGRHGEMCFWDLRMRQLRSSIKAFDNATVKTLVGDPNNEFFVAGSSDGDIKIWSQDAAPQLVYALSGEHAARGGFSLRQVGGGNVQGVQQVFVDEQQRLFSCGADCSLKLRVLPSILHNI